MFALPLIGPLLTWIAGPFLSFAKGLGHNIGVIAAAAFKNPYVIGALVAAAFFLLWQHDRARYQRLEIKAEKADTAWREAFGTERAAFATVDEALKGQNIAVRGLWSAGQAKLKSSSRIASGAAPAQAVAQAKANAILSAPKGSDCEAAKATFDAARKALQ